MKELKTMDGERLRRLRKEKKLTQTELGKIINVTKVSISGYENGDRTPDTDNLRRLADYFDVTTDYLMGRDVNDRQYIIDKISREFPNANLMFDDLVNMNAGQLEKVYDFIKYELYRGREK